MALQFMPIEVIFRGVGEHSDPKTQIPGELESCENAVFTKRGRIAKRRGYQLVPVATDVEGDDIDPHNLFLAAGQIHRELVVIGYDTCWSLVARETAFGSGHLVARGPTFRGNVHVQHVATAPLTD
ncbi:MAG: hypothetical protein KC501_40990 [Myxococcales bacterium]|nr:hypothetical protein [Myxococcales bacterium]